MATMQIHGSAQIKSATITNTEISASAAIALSKLAEAVIQADGGQAFTADQPMGGFKLTNLGTPSAGGDATNKTYVDGVASGLDVKASVRLATDAALAANTAGGSGIGKTLTADANGALSVDGVAVAVGNRILVKDEVTALDNGIYTVTATGDGSNPYILTRATDADQDAEVTAGLFTFVAEGTANADTGWVLITNDPITVDTTALSFSQFSGAGSITAGAGLTKTGNTLDVGDAGKGIQVNANDIEFSTAEVLDAGGGLKAGSDTYKIVVEPADFAGTGLEDDGSDNLRIAASAAGAGLTGGGGSALAVGAGTGITVNANDVAVDGTVVTNTRYIANEVPTGTINGVNADFTLANTPESGKTMVFRNGVLQIPTTHYTIAGAVITMNEAPLTGDSILATYIVD